MTFNQPQKCVMIGAIAVILIMGLVPPWKVVHNESGSSGAAAGYFSIVTDHISTIEYKKIYKERSKISSSNQSKETAPTPSKPTPHPLRSTQTLEDIRLHQPLTDKLTDQLSQVMRPASFSGFFKNMAVIEADDSSITISIGQSELISDWAKEHYSGILNRIADKKVNIVN